MKATYDNLKEKTQYQHKMELCELNFKFKELEVLLENSTEKIARLKKENKALKKKLQCNTTKGRQFEE